MRRGSGGGWEALGEGERRRWAAAEESWLLLLGMAAAMGMRQDDEEEEEGLLELPLPRLWRERRLCGV